MRRQTIKRALWIMPFTVFAVAMCWALAYGSKEVAERMIADGHPLLATVVILAAAGFVAAGMWLYRRMTEPPKIRPSPARR